MIEEGLVFGYDTGFPFISKSIHTYRFNLGEPTTTFDVGTMLPTSPNTSFSSNPTYHSNLHGTLWDWAYYPNSNIHPSGGMQWMPDEEGPTFTGAWKMKKRPGGNSESNFQGVNPGTVSTASAHTVSVMCKTTQAGCFRIHINTTKDGSSFWGYASGYHSGGGEWEKLSVTVPANAGNTSINTIRCQGIGTTVTANALWRDYQVEINDNATQFILNGTRSVSGSLFDITGNHEIDVSNVSFNANAQLDFDGTDDRIDTALYHLSGSDHTEEVVVYRETAGVQQGILSDLQYGFFGLYFQSDNKIRYRQMQQLSNPTSYPNVNVVTPDTYGVGTYHIVGSFSSTNGFRLYVNGVLKNSNSTDLPFNLSGNRGINHIGVYKDSAASNYNHPFDGQIYIVRCYNRELTAGEIQQNFTALRGRFNI
jgi:hypothetical protein